ncbi:MAG: sigma-54 interaction domain-containing protein [Candidatus Binataceae bacterium]
MSREQQIAGSRRNAEWLEIETLQAESVCPGIVGRSPAIRTVVAAIERFAPHKGTVLVTGESGTGKEVVTRALHQRGPFADGPLVSFNCSNLVSGLAESQLFGHIKGAFTHAREAALGCFRQAQLGTLLLDEIGELPPGMQAKLLRVAESLEVQPVGSTETVQVDLRLLAATNRNLREMVKAGSFRADLYYRLDVASIKLPALRERVDDIGPLTAHFVDRYNHIFGKRIRLISRRALDLLHAHRWPGNVRELAHVIERAALLSEDERIDIDDLPAELVEATPSQPRPVGWSAGPIDTAGEARGSVKPLDHILREAVEQSLRQARGDCAKAARILGISRPAIYRKMVRLGISNAAVRRYRGFPQPALTRSARDRPAHEAPAAGPSAHATTPNYPASHK